jgi:hypothetical protein
MSVARARASSGEAASHAAALATAAGVDLRLHHAAPAELAADRARLGRLVDHPALRRGNAEAAQDLLGLVLVDLHSTSRTRM